MALVGINNENEFYSNHYLGEVFTSDIRDAGTPIAQKMQRVKRSVPLVNRAKTWSRDTALRGTSLTVWRLSFSANLPSTKNSVRSRSVWPINVIAGSHC